MKKLQLKIGDKLYWRCGKGGKVVCGVIKDIHQCDSYNVYDTCPNENVTIYFYSDDFGEIVFLTEEEAIKTRKR